MTEPIKKRKWDQDDHNDSAAKVTKIETTADPSKAVSEAAARINAMLAQKGIPIHNEDESTSPNSDSANVAKKESEFVKDIPINDLKNRYLLTRGATQAQIQRDTGADVISRGKYYPDVSLATEKEPPLYLHITAADQESLDNAVAKIEELIETAQVPLPGTGYPPREDRQHDNHLNNRRPERKFYDKKLPVSIEGPIHFNLRAKIVGPQGAYVKHIQTETGCRVQLKGKGSGFYESSTGVESEEPLHIHVSSAREDELEKAVKLTEDLLNSVRAEAERGPPQRYQEYGRGGGGGGHRGGYNNSYNNHNGYNNNGYNNNGYNNSNYNSPAPAHTAAVSPTAAADPYANYDYSKYYAQYYQQAGAYDANAYYSYYGYPPAAAPGTDATPATSTAAPPPPGSDNISPPPPPPSSSSPPPPPPPSSSSPPPPPPPSA